MTSYLELNRCNLILLSATSRNVCPCRTSPKTLSFNHQSSKFNPRLSVDGSRYLTWSPRPWRVRCASDDRIMRAVSGTNHLSQGESKEEAKESKSQSSQLKKRVVFGLAIGIGGGVVVLTGGWIFTVALSAAIFVGSREYFELVSSRGIADGMTPPPQYVSRACSVICAIMPILTL
ncbi:hypothetical protein GIB67_021789 [Kingdonia uniflora]|uniref:phosphatidate cytidylyltransferase n=1 Tax=Kingdonia uniflora TaxID=39325 RepID=A0A7J7P2Z6_9MAGN|nr:hypothetical protein GIB67_021789 [Kingdonia uniflora]